MIVLGIVRLFWQSIIRCGNEMVSQLSNELHCAGNVDLGEDADNVSLIILVHLENFVKIALVWYFSSAFHCLR